MKIKKMAQHATYRRKIGLALLCLLLSAFSFSKRNSSKGNPSSFLKAPQLFDISKKDADQQDPLFFIEGQLCQHLRTIFEDSKGNLWFGTNVYDLMMYNGDSLVYLTKEDGFTGGRVTGFEEDQKGNIWIATGFGLNKYDGKSFTQFTEADGLSNSEIWSLHLDSKEILWVGHNEGLSSFDGKEFRDISVPKATVEAPDIVYSANRITDIEEDQEGNLWLGTDGFGICKYDGSNFKSYTMENGLVNNTIYELMIDTKGQLWIGTFWGGLSIFDGESFTNFIEGRDLGGVEVGGFFEERNGDIWFAVENDGVYKYDGNSLQNLYKEVGLNGVILSIYRDKKERFWFGGWGGLFRYDGKTFSSVTKKGPWD